MIEINCKYSIKSDIEFIMDSENINLSVLSSETGISRTSLDEILQTDHARCDVCEKIYSYIYSKNYRMNSVKEQFLKEHYGNVLFHGSKNGLSHITIENARKNCDFGQGFYLGESYNQARSFIWEKDKSSVYSFIYKLDNLNTLKMECNMEWMLAICYYRGTLARYSSNQIIRNIIDKVEHADVIIAPIADNKMFYIMTQFTDGEINADVALHSLSASYLGMQYIFRSDKALKNLIPMEQYYLSDPERKDCQQSANERAYQIDTKLKLAKREYRNGLYIEEIFDERI